MQFSSDKEAVDILAKKYGELKAEIGKVIIGQYKALELCTISILSSGHCLLEGVPGLAKTLLVKTISSALDLKFNRIQFTPDLMPSDITGAEILDEKRNFKFTEGPIFSNIILADEINRTPPKTQAALLEAMQEHSVTIAGLKHNLPLPFFVLATQNPIEQEGTYPLPEAQLDRFMFNIQMGYPTQDEEIQIVKNTTTIDTSTVNKVLDADSLISFQQLIRKIPVTDNVIQYAVNLVGKTRPNTKYAATIANEYLSWGAGPRASQYLILAAKSHAALQGKYVPDIEDVKAIASPILYHRIIRNFKAEAENLSIENIINNIL